MSETIGVGDSKVGQTLPIELNACFLQTFHQDTIGDPVDPRCRVDPNDPQAPEISLPRPPVPIGVLERLVYRLGRDPEKLAFGSPVPLCKLENPFPSLS